MGAAKRWGERSLLRPRTACAKALRQESPREGGQGAWCVVRDGERGVGELDFAEPCQCGFSPKSTRIQKGV